MPMESSIVRNCLPVACMSSSLSRRTNWQPISELLLALSKGLLLTTKVTGMVAGEGPDAGVIVTEVLNVAELPVIDGIPPLFRFRVTGTGCEPVVPLLVPYTHQRRQLSPGARRESAPRRLAKSPGGARPPIWAG